MPWRADRDYRDGDAAYHAPSVDTFSNSPLSLPLFFGLTSTFAFSPPPISGSSYHTSLPVIRFYLPLTSRSRRNVALELPKAKTTGKRQVPDTRETTDKPSGRDRETTYSSNRKQHTLSLRDSYDLYNQ